MLYSAAEAPISWAGLFFIFPHLCIGGALLWATWRGKVWLKGMSGTPGLVVQALAGGVFFATSVWVIATNVHKTLVCRTAAAERKGITARGAVVIEQRYSRPGGNSYIRFSVDGHSLRTFTQGLSSDCGYLQPVGKSVQITDGRKVQVRALDHIVLTMETAE